MSKTSRFRRVRDTLSAAVAALGATSLVAGAVVLGAAGAAQGVEQDVPCGTPAKEAVYETIYHPETPAVYETVVVQEGKDAWTETIEHPAEYETVTIPAVVETKTVPGQRWAWNPTGPNLSPGDSTPLTDPERWTANTSNYNGTDPLEEAFQQGAGNQGNNASWFYWTTETVEVVIEPERTEEQLVKEAWTETIEHPAVPEITEERLVTPAKPAWTEQKLVSPAVPAGPPCPQEPGEPPVTPGEPPVDTPVTPGEPPVDTPVTPIDTPAVDEDDDILGDDDVIAGDDEEASGDDDLVLGDEAVPTAVDAGLGGSAVPVSYTGGLLGQAMVVAGLLMLLLAGSAQLGRRRRGAHEV
jgi:hypothetical protein